MCSPFDAWLTSKAQLKTQKSVSLLERDGLNRFKTSHLHSQNGLPTANTHIFHDTQRVKATAAQQIWDTAKDSSENASVLMLYTK